MNLYHVDVMVIDAQPETTPAQAIAKQFPRRVLLAYYTTQPVRGDEPIKVNWDDRVVSLDRTATLDGSAMRLRNQQDVFPAMPHDLRRQFVDEMTSSLRGIEKDKHGQARAFLAGGRPRPLAPCA